MNLNLNVVREKDQQNIKKREIKNSKGTFKIGNLYFKKDRLTNHQPLQCIEIKKIWVGAMILNF